MRDWKFVKFSSSAKKSYGTKPYLLIGGNFIILLLLHLSLIFLFSFSLLFFYFLSRNREQNRRAGDESVERQRVTFTGNSRMKPSKMDGYVYTSFRPVIVPWNRQKSRQKRKLQESRRIWKIFTLPLLYYRKLQFRRPVENRSRSSIEKVFYLVSLRENVKRNISRFHSRLCFRKFFNFSFRIIELRKRRKKERNAQDLHTFSTKRVR